jgi:hypothetical protein
MYDWIGANWIWLVAGIGALWFVLRRGNMGCGMDGHSHGSEPSREGQDDSHAGHAGETGATHDQAAGASAAPRRRHGCC